MRQYAIDAAFMRPTRQECVQISLPRQVGVGVHGDFDAIGARLVDHRQQFADPPAIDLEAEVAMRQMRRHPSARRPISMESQ